MTLREVPQLFLKAFRNWNEDNATRMAASLAFYAILSFAPLLLFVITVGGQFLDSQQVQSTLIHQARSQMGPSAVNLIQNLIESGKGAKSGAGTGVISIVLALLGGSGLFDQLTLSFNTIWKTTPSKGHAIKLFLLSKLISVAMTLIFLVLMVIWIGIDSVVSYMRHHTDRGFPLWHQVSFLISVTFLTGVFAVTFKSIPRGMVAWRDVWFPAFVTGLGFAIAKYLLSLYFGLSSIGERYGSAGAIVVVLIWFYYSAQIFFFGVELAFAYSYSHGSHKRETEGQLQMS